MPFRAGRTRTTLANRTHICRRRPPPALFSGFPVGRSTAPGGPGHAADGAAPTLTQALMLIQQALTEVSISGTSMTIKKLDGSTTAVTLTLNDATAPTAKTRSG